MTALEDFADRLARVQAQMLQRGIAGLVACFNGQHYMLRFNAILYLTDFKPLGPAFLFVPATGRPILLTSPDWDLERAREQCLIAELVAAPQISLLEKVVDLARQLPRPLAVAGMGQMPAGLSQKLTASLDPFQLADDLIDSLATRRTELELRRVTRAASIADEGFRCLRETARVGMREFELAAEIECAMQWAGSEDNYGLLGAGSHNSAVRAPTNRMLEDGDVVIGEITPCYRGYFAQLCRTFILGTPTAAQREKYDLLVRAEEAGLAVALPGRPGGNIAKAVNAVFSAAGYAAFCRQPYMRTRGHGLGFGGVIPADLTETATVLLATNMTMVVHPNQYLPETGYMMLGDTIVIEPTGPRKLTKTPVRLFSKVN